MHTLVPSSGPELPTSDFLLLTTDSRLFSGILENNENWTSRCDAAGAVCGNGPDGRGLPLELFDLVRGGSRGDHALAGV